MRLHRFVLAGALAGAAILGATPAMADTRTTVTSLNGGARAAVGSPAHLQVALYDRVSDSTPMATFTDQDQTGPFLNLNYWGVADRAARVVVTKGPAYQPGDHLRLLDRTQTSGTDMIDLDPATVGQAVLNEDLNKVSFADKAAAMQFFQSPTAFAPRIDLYDTVNQPYPNLSIYSWQADAWGRVYLTDLNFRAKAARVNIVDGSVALATWNPAFATRVMAPGSYDLNTVISIINGSYYSWADRTEAFRFGTNFG
jgi:hypothetical protein